MYSFLHRALIDNFLLKEAAEGPQVRAARQLLPKTRDFTNGLELALRKANAGKLDKLNPREWRIIRHLAEQTGFFDKNPKLKASILDSLKSSGLSEVAAKVGKFTQPGSVENAMIALRGAASNPNMPSNAISPYVKKLVEARDKVVKLLPTMRAGTSGPSFGGVPAIDYLRNGEVKRQARKVGLLNHVRKSIGLGGGSNSLIPFVENLTVEYIPGPSVRSGSTGFSNGPIIDAEIVEEGKKLLKGRGAGKRLLSAKGAGKAGLVGTLLAGAGYAGNKLGDYLGNMLYVDPALERQKKVNAAYDLTVKELAKRKDLEKNSISKFLRNNSTAAAGIGLGLGGAGIGATIDSNNRLRGAAIGAAAGGTAGVVGDLLRKKYLA